MQIVEVKAGDTLYALARRYATTVEALAWDNQIADPARLTPGQTLVVPGGSSNPRRCAEVNAYAYPNIAPEVLQEALPFLTALCPFSWRFDAQGTLIPLADERLIEAAYAADTAPMLTLTNIGENGGFSSELGHVLLTDGAVQDAVLNETMPYFTALCPFSHSVTAEGELRPIEDERLIRAACAGQTVPLLTITNLGETGGFSSDLAHTVLTDEGVQARLFDNIVSLIREKDYYGLNINFEYIYPFDRDSYSQFVKRAAERLHPLGCPVSTAIAPKESADQDGLLYTAHDYAAHGKYADRVILMT